MRRTSDAGVELIKSFEGLRLETYLDSAGKPTIGYGHLIKPGEDFSGGITVSRAEELLREDLAEAEEAVGSLVRHSLNDNQFAALVSFVFNVGGGAFRNSTLLRKLNKGDCVGAAGEFTRWNRAGGRSVEGLLRRRIAEMQLFRKR